MKDLRASIESSTIPIECSPRQSRDCETFQSVMYITFPKCIHYGLASDPAIPEAIRSSVRPACEAYAGSKCFTQSSCSRFDAEW